MIHLKTITVTDVDEQFENNLDLTKTLMVEGYLHKTQQCVNCGADMQLRTRKMNYEWRCRQGVKDCSSKSVKTGTWFEKTHLDLITIFKLMLMWAEKHTIEKMARKLKLSPVTVWAYRKFFEQIALPVSNRENEKKLVQTAANKEARLITETPEGLEKKRQQYAERKRRLQLKNEVENEKSVKTIKDEPTPPTKIQRKKPNALIKDFKEEAKREKVVKTTKEEPMPLVRSPYPPNKPNKPDVLLEDFEVKEEARREKAVKIAKEEPKPLVRSPSPPNQLNKPDVLLEDFEVKQEVEGTPAEMLLFDCSADEKPEVGIDPEDFNDEGVNAVDLMFFG